MNDSDISSRTDPTSDTVDVVVIGAGFAGLYLAHQLRSSGFSFVVLDAAADVGGTWYWNRYPGLRCDVPTTDYAYSWDPKLANEWEWSEKYATQPEILRYLQFVADKHDLRRHIRFSTRVTGAEWVNHDHHWRIETESGPKVSGRHLVMATGSLSIPKSVDLDGLGRFGGEVYSTSRWPAAGVDFTGKRVAVVGTGSSGIQTIPIVAEQAAELFVLQRTPAFSLPAQNGPAPADRLRRLKEDCEAYREEARWSPGGLALTPTEQRAIDLSADEKRERLEAAWEDGSFATIANVFADQLTNKVANDEIADFIRAKIRSIVDDPNTAESLCPSDFPFQTKRPCFDTNYYATFNEDHVQLVDLRREPITTLTEVGIDTTERSIEIDVLVLATGYDAMTGAVLAIDPVGRNGLALKEKWSEGPTTYLGLMSVGFPNMFMITGPGSPSVLSNMVVSIEQHVDWIMNCLEHLRSAGLESIEPTPTAEAGWVQHVNDCADITLFPHANSWYVGANVSGKPRVFMPYTAGVGRYRSTCDRVVNDGYLGFALSGNGEVRCNDGVVNRLQPDVTAVLDQYEGPSFGALSAVDTRQFMTALTVRRPEGPPVADVVDGSLPGPAGNLQFRLYRPPGEGRRPIVVYFHGGGWVLGDQTSDDPFCRDLCNRSNCIVVSVDYRHAPEARFPAGVNDAYAALRWIDAHATELGGTTGQIAVAGWSTGANLATVVCSLARDAGAPVIAGQLLVNPVVDCDFGTKSYRDNGDGYMLTADAMRWFFDQYVDDEHRLDPRVSPLRMGDFSGLPPAVVVTSEFDPLRDEGVAYAEALAGAGVATQSIVARGQIHTSLTMIDVVISANPLRDKIAQGIRGFFALENVDTTGHTQLAAHSVADC